MSKQYKKSPIAEVICEFRFELGDSFDRKMVDLFFNEVKEKFPKKKNGRAHQVNLEINPNEQKQNIDNSSYDFDLFFSDDEKTLIQLDKGRLSIHKLRPYDSWREFYATINLVFNSYIKIIKIKSIQRIGLRYVNNFEIPSPSLEIEQYFNLRPAIGESLPQNLVSFAVGAVFVFENGRDNMKVQFLDRPGISPEKMMFVLDMDYFLANPNGVQINEVEQWLINAHKNVENIFETALTDKTKQLFD